jgi:hypothetical protein
VIMGQVYCEPAATAATIAAGTGRISSGSLTIGQNRKRRALQRAKAR